MTNREFYTAILSSNLSAELKEFAAAEIAKLDARNDKRKNTPNKTQLANEPVKTAIIEYVSAHPNAVASDIATACDVSTQKVSALCKQLINGGILSVKDIKVKNKGTLKAYSVVEG